MTPGKWKLLRGALETAFDHRKSSRMDAVIRRLGSHLSLVPEARRLVLAFDGAEAARLNELEGIGPERRAFQNGQVLASRFEIRAFLGMGGMGEVYEALDKERDSAVALKTLRAGVVWSEPFERRFLREVELALLVAHPNVCRIHDLFHHVTTDPETGKEIRQPFLIMELLRGDTLAKYLADNGALEPREALGIIRQLVAALAAAHDTGIVHRDFKTANIFLVPQNEGFRAVVTDFGLAGLMQQVGDAPERFFEPGNPDLVGGTEGYSAPEQLQGRPVTAAADVYSLGVVVCEMLTGALPCAESMERLPAVWRKAVTICLEEESSRRYQSVREFAAAVDPYSRIAEPAWFTPRRTVLAAFALAAGATSTRYAWRRFVSQPVRVSSLAVLPFQLSGLEQDRNADQLFSGFTGELVKTLLTSKRLRIKGQYSASKYKTPYDFRKISKELGADALLTGVLTASAVEVRLLSSDASMLWHQSFPRLDRSEYDLHRSIESALISSLSGMGAEFSVPKRYTPSKDAYIAFLRGRFFWGRRWAKEHDVEEAQRWFQKAVGTDPKYAAAWAGLATILQYSDKMGDARNAARNALNLDPDLADAHLALGIVYQRADWDWTLAEASFRKALDLEPSNPVGHHWYAGFLSDMGRFVPSAREFEIALDLEPLSLPVNIAYGICLCYAREFDRSLHQLENAAKLDKSASRIYPFLGACHLFKGNSSLALEYYRRAKKQSPVDPVIASHLVYGLSHTGHEDEARSELTTLLNGPASTNRPFYVAMACDAVGDRSRALALLDRAHERRDADMTLLKVHPYLDGLRSESRYGELLKVMNLA